MPKPHSIPAILKKHNLEHQAEAIQSSLIPSLRMVCDWPAPKSIAVGVSRLGGEPDLPDAEPWPQKDDRPLHFIGQIRLSEAAKHLPRGALPARGWVRLWIDSLGLRKREEQLMSGKFRAMMYEPSYVILTHDPDEERPLARRPWPAHDEHLPEAGDPWEPFGASPITFESMLCLNRQAVEKIRDFEEAADPETGSDRLTEAVGEIEQERPYDGDDHRLLGDLEEVQTDSRFSAACKAAGVYEFADRTKAAEEELRAQAAHYRLLAKIDSDARGRHNFQWGDMGSLQWWIREDHLAAGDLGKAVGLYEQGG